MMVRAVQLPRAFLVMATLFATTFVEACVDSDPVNCDMWMRSSECRINPHFMQTFCKQSCGNCALSDQQIADKTTQIMAECDDFWPTSTCLTTDCTLAYDIASCRKKCESCECWPRCTGGQCNRATAKCDCRDGWLFGDGSCGTPCPAFKKCSNGVQQECGAFKSCQLGIEAECPDGKICSGGQVRTCSAGKRCSGGQEFDCGLNVLCLNGREQPCPDGSLCVGGSQKPCGEGKLCVGGQEVACGDAKLCFAGMEHECDPGKLCVNGLPEQCPANQQCAGGLARPCPFAQRCSNGVAGMCGVRKVCENGAERDCAPHKLCSGGQERPCPDNSKCINGAAIACAPAKKCSSGVESPCGGVSHCHGGIEEACASGMRCVNGTQVACPAGWYCVAGTHTEPCPPSRWGSNCANECTSCPAPLAPACHGETGNCTVTAGSRAGSSGGADDDSGGSMVVVAAAAGGVVGAVLVATVAVVAWKRRRVDKAAAERRKANAAEMDGAGGTIAMHNVSFDDGRVTRHTNNVLDRTASMFGDPNLDGQDGHYAGLNNSTTCASTEGEDPYAALGSQTYGSASEPGYADAANRSGGVVYTAVRNTNSNLSADSQTNLLRGGEAPLYANVQPVSSQGAVRGKEADPTLYTTISK